MEASLWRACRVNGVRRGEEGVFMERDLPCGAEKRHEERKDRPLIRDSTSYQQPLSHWTDLGGET